MEPFSIHYKPSPIESLRSSVLDASGIQLMIKRDDLLQPAGNDRFCGNKVRKLKYNLMAAKAAAYDRLLTFGGAYSNHIAAVAAAGKLYGLETIGVIRGEAYEPLNPTLAQAVADGMQLGYLDRARYREKDKKEVIHVLKQDFGPFYLIPEGGTNSLALKGCAEMIAEIEQQLQVLPDYVCAACGTGGTLTGMIQGAAGRSRLIGISALRGTFMRKEVSQLLGEGFPQQNWAIHTDYHFGGYAKFPDELRSFVQEFEKEYAVLLDPVYTSKLFFGVLDLIRKGYFPKGSKVLVVHSGGLQGWGGFRRGRRR